jgi:hypothetical protein
LLRGALANTGEFSQGRYPRQFLRELGDQLILGCDSGKLECTTQVNIPRLGAIRKEHIPIILDFIKEDLVRLFSYDTNYTMIVPIGINNPAFTKDYLDFEYFDEFTNNPIDMRTMVGSVTQDGRVLVGGRNELRLFMLQIKQKLMEKMVLPYKYFTLALTLLIVLFWIVTFLVRLIKKHKFSYSEELNLFLFLIMLFVSRLGMLDILRATSTLPGIMPPPVICSLYCSIFILLFSQ